MEPRQLAFCCDSNPDGVRSRSLARVSGDSASHARVITFAEVIGLDVSRRAVKVRYRQSSKIETLGADLIVNATGPWAGKVAALAGLKVEIEPSAGAMVTLGTRLCNMVINRLAPPGDGDIIVPQRQTSILGTTSWTVADPDDIPIPPDHVQRIPRLRS
jgi:glycerol-3-phosphate dehydrogenase